MTTDKLLKAMGAQAFGETFQAEIRNIYEADIQRGAFGETESDCDEAMRVLSARLSADKQQLVADLGETCSLICEFSASYGFVAGLYCGFCQYFTEEQYDDGGFDKYVVREIDMMPNMQHHFKNYDNINRRNEISQQLTEGETEEISEHIVSLECAWGQRAHSASINGFYCGYRAAIAVIDRVTPFACSKVKMDSKILSMEHRLGYIKSFEEIERENERRSTNDAATAD